MPLLLYMVYINCWVHAGILIQNIRSPRARANHPPEEMYFQVKKKDDACPGLRKKLGSLCSAAYGRWSILLYWYMNNQSEYHVHTIP